MCGRFTLRTPIAEVAELFRAEVGRELALPPLYNIAPTQPVLVVRSGAEEGTRELTLLRWGLIPGWVKDPEEWPTLVNARAETLHAKPAFEDAFRFRRCLVPADGFYEWRREPGGKQPYYVRLAEERPMAFAGLWERWAGADETVESCTIVTTDANRLLAPLHDRMPVILDAEGQERWMDPELRSPRALAELLRPFPSGRLVAYPVSRRVNRAEVDGPECIEPLPGRDAWRGDPPTSRAIQPQEGPGGTEPPAPEPAAPGPTAPEPTAPELATPDAVAPAPEERRPGGGEAAESEAPPQLDLF